MSHSCLKAVGNLGYGCNIATYAIITDLQSIWDCKKEKDKGRAQENRDIRRKRMGGNHRTEGWLLKEALSLLVSEDWPPRQISGYLSLSGKRIPHETIYRRIREDGSGNYRNIAVTG